MQDAREAIELALRLLNEALSSDSDENDTLMAIDNLVKLFSTIKEKTRAYIPQAGFQKEMKD